jgi:hypothetical protein
LRQTFAIAGMILLGAVAAARADTLTTFDLSGVTFQQDTAGTGTATGSFVYDSTTGALSDIDIVTTSGTWQNGLSGTPAVEPGVTYDALTLTNAHSTAPTPPNTHFDFFFFTSSSELILGVLNGPSLTAPTALLNVGIESNESSLTGSGFTRDVASGSIDPQISATPLPAALPLFAGGLGMIGFVARRRKRNGSALAA